jgi:hypothetical protein
MFDLINPNGPSTFHPLITATWPVSDPFELALWLGAVATAVGRHPTYLDGVLAPLAQSPGRPSGSGRSAPDLVGARFPWGSIGANAAFGNSVVSNGRVSGDTS